MSQNTSNSCSQRKLSQQEQEEHQQYKIKVYTKNKIEEFRQEVRQQQINQLFNKKRQSFCSQQSDQANQEIGDQEDFEQIQSQSQQQFVSTQGLRTRYLFQDDIQVLELKTQNDNLVQINFQDKTSGQNNAPDANTDENTVMNITYNSLQSYLKGEKTDFQEVIQHIDMQKLNATPFQIKVWEQLLKIPYGQYITYKQLAINIGQPTAIRAVANACGQNRIPIVIPCHRVIGSDNSLTGFAGGLQRKKFLLDVEKIKIQ